MVSSLYLLLHPCVETALELALDGLGHGLGKVLNIGLVETSHRDAAVAGKVDVGLLGEGINLLGREAGEREHANLRLDVAPLAGSVELNELVVKLLTHVDNAVGHELDLGEPLSLELGRGKDGGDEASTAGEMSETVPSIS